MKLLQKREDISPEFARKKHTFNSEILKAMF